MSRAKFSWEPLTGGSLLLRVTQGEKDTTWKITKNTKPDRLITILWEVQEAMALGKALELPPELTNFTLDRRIVINEPTIIGHSSDAVTEDMSKAALDFKVKAVTMTGGHWYDNEADDDLPLYVLGHGEEEK